MQYMLDNDMLPALTTVDLSEYRMPLKPPADLPGFMMRLAHPNSRITRVLLPPDAESTFYASLCLKKMLDQGFYLRQRNSRKIFTVVVADTDATVRTSRAHSLLKTIRDFDIPNVHVEF
jgi:hypothetical protein